MWTGPSWRPRQRLSLTRRCASMLHYRPPASAAERIAPCRCDLKETRWNGFWSQQKQKNARSRAQMKCRRKSCTFQLLLKLRNFLFLLVNIAPKSIEHLGHLCDLNQPFKPLES